MDINMVEQLEKEIWKKIDYSNYCISNKGNIKSNYKILKQQKDIDGYCVVKIVYKGKKRNVKVHRLVAQVFIPNPENKPQVNHINGIKTDNRVGNLEWVTASENERHKYKIGLITHFAKVNSQKGSMKKVVKMKNGIELENYESLSQASEYNNVSKQSISYAIKHKSNCLNYQWKWGN